MPPSWFRFGRQLCRVLGVLALLGQAAVGAVPPQDVRPGAEIRALTAIGAFCHGGSHQTGDNDGQPCHCHDLSPCLPAGSTDLPYVLPAASPTLQPPMRIVARRHDGLPPGARAPPSRRVQSGTPRGPPAVPA